jgi:hypothetical protein
MFLRVRGNRGSRISTAVLGIGSIIKVGAFEGVGSDTHMVRRFDSTQLHK